MSVTELDKWRAAQQLIAKHGADAEFEAAQLADRAIAQGSPEGERLWLDVMGKVRALQSDKAPGGGLN